MADEVKQVEETPAVEVPTTPVAEPTVVTPLEVPVTPTEEVKSDV